MTGGDLRRSFKRMATTKTKAPKQKTSNTGKATKPAKKAPASTAKADPTAGAGASPSTAVASRASSPAKSAPAAAADDPPAAAAAAPAAAAATVATAAQASDAGADAIGDADTADAAANDDAGSDELTAEDFEPRRARVAIGRIRARWPALTDEERAAFDSVSTPDQRMAKGGRTRAIAVAADATRWAGQLDRQMKLYPVLQEHYHPKRFAYFLERTDALVTTLGTELQLGDDRRVVRQGANDGLALALDARQRLLVVLRRFANRRSAFVAQIAEARGDEQTPEGLVLSITRLAALGSRWSAAGPGALVETSGLTPQLLRDARAACDSLASAGADVIETGNVEANDTPEINLVEGWVLEEMLRARDDVAEAKKEDPRIKLLFGHKGTRHVVGRARRKATPGDADATDATVTTSTATTASGEGSTAATAAAPPTAKAAAPATAAPPAAKGPVAAE